jgi:hypothetical protein
MINVFYNSKNLVGENNIETFSYDEFNYDKVVSHIKINNLKKQLLLGHGSDKLGKNNVNSISFLFLKTDNNHSAYSLPSSLFSLNKKNNNSLNYVKQENFKDVQCAIDLFDENNSVYYNNFFFLNYSGDFKTNDQKDVSLIKLFNDYNFIFFNKNDSYCFFLNNSLNFLISKRNQTFSFYYYYFNFIFNFYKNFLYNFNDLFFISLNTNNSNFNNLKKNKENFFDAQINKNVLISSQNKFDFIFKNKLNKYFNNDDTFLKLKKNNYFLINLKNSYYEIINNNLNFDLENNFFLDSSVLASNLIVNF